MADLRDGTVLDRQLSKGRQGRRLVSVQIVKGRKVRVTVYRDSYEDQSYAYAELFCADRGWVSLHTLWTPQILQVSHVQEDKFRWAAAVDEQALLNRAHDLLTLTPTEKVAADA